VMLFVSVSVTRSKPKQSGEQHSSAAVSWEPSWVWEESGSSGAGELGWRLNHYYHAV